MCAVSMIKSPSGANDRHSKVNPIAVSLTASILPKAGATLRKAADVECVLAAVILGSLDVPFVYLRNRDR